MADIVISGDSSGSVTLRAPAVSGTTVLTLPTTSGTLVTTAGGSTVPFALGSAAAPSITFTGDTNTGIYSPAADTIAFTEGGVESMRIDASGNLGIGTSSPTSKLQVVDSGTGANTVLVQSGQTGTTPRANTVLRLQTTATGRDVNIQFSDNVTNAAEIGMVGGAQYFATAGTERMRIDSSGNVGIGTSSPTSKLDVSGQIRVRTGFNILADELAEYTGAGGLTIRTGATSPIIFNTNSAERMRIDSSGSLLVGTTSNTGSNHRQYIVGSNNVLGINATAGGTAENIRFYNAGTAVGTIQTTATATIYNTSSDYRLKENVVPMTGALGVVAQLNPVTYNWKFDGSSGQGFIAHELQAVVPDCVTGEKDAVDADGKPVYQGIDTSFLVATLTAAIQELNAKVTALEKQLGAK